MLTELNLAKAAAAAASAVLLPQYVGASEVVSDSGKDIKLSADKLAEDAILARLRATSSYPILSEECGAGPDWDDAGRYWVVDPLDGSFNFNRHLPLCCVSIGLWEADHPLLGVVHDFHSGTVYSGIVGQGAWCNDRAIRVSPVSSVAKAALGTGFPSQRDFSSASLLSFVTKVAAFKKLRLLGSAALSLAYVAAGSLEAYQEEDIWFWDVAAGLALVQAAGGSCLVLPGRSRFQKCVFASNGLISLDNPD
jgi:myo-inositol-1(or 4)-monophosphatase